MHAGAPSRTEPNLFARDLFDGLADRYDLLAEVLSFGQNRRWRAAMVDVVAGMDPPPQRVLDVATGTAGVALMLTERTGAGVTGLDVTEEMLRRGRARIAARGRADRIRLLVGCAEQLPFPDSTFDALTFTYLMRYVTDPPATIR
jgi:demethylmenaquinone methyltransferase/2-methoxy-6-polyprenyl-1,4-benzoquinol methylase